MRRIIEVPVGDLMSAPALTVKPETPIEELTRLFIEYEFNALPVVNDLRTLQGIVTQLDLFKLHLLPYPHFVPALETAWASSVGAIMSSSVITLSPVEPAIKAMALMVDYRIRTIPVVNDAAGGKVVVGIVTRRDLMAVLKAEGSEDPARG
jgi:CBS-domain-containing membrane protein